MKRIAHIARTGEEELALMAHFADRNGIVLENLGLEGLPLPEDLSNCDGVIILGNPRGSQRPAFHDRIFDLVREAVKTNLPVLGISGGARLLAEICRDSVDAGIAGAGFWSSFRFTEEGRKDTLFFGLSDSCTLYREYGDALVLPPGATVIAVDNRGLPVAFRYGNAYGLDFALPRARCLSGNEQISGTGVEDTDEDQACRDLLSLVRTILGNFLWLTELCRASRPDRGQGDAKPAAL